MYYIYTDNQGNYTVAQAPSGAYVFKVAGPMTFAEARAWMHNNGKPGW